MAVPEWVDRLREASFVSPNGIESTFKIDVLTRIGGKKVSNHEILNSNESIPQDQGNKARRYPLDVYFTGETGDQESDAFFESLHEDYSIDSPGVLYHPVWGDIAVMPFTDPQQTHNLVSGGGIFRVSVEFITVPQTDFPTPEGVDQSDIIDDIDSLEDALAIANEGIDIENAGRFAEFRAKVISVVNTVDNAIGDIADEIDDIEERYRQIQSDINAVLQIGADAVEVMSQVNNLIRLPGQIADSTIGKVQAYATMAQGIYDSFVGFFNPNSDRITQINDALTFQNTYGIASAAITEAALFTDYETRDQAADVLDIINEIQGNFEEQMSVISETIDGLVVDLFAPDHDTGLSLNLINGKVNAVLLDRSFSLKARRDIVLTAPSDAITLTWQYYNSIDLDDIDFFIRTNMLTDLECLEIPAGRSIVVYV